MRLERLRPGAPSSGFRLFLQVGSTQRIAYTGPSSLGAPHSQRTRAVLQHRLGLPGRIEDR